MIISFVSAKGGVGKTTIALNLATALAQRGKSVLLMDSCPDAATHYFSEARTARDDLPEDQNIDFAVIENDLLKAMDEYKSKYDFVITDTPFLHQLELKKAVALNSDIILAPIRPSQLDLISIDAVDSLYKHGREFNPGLRAFALLSMIQDETGIDPDASETVGAENYVVRNHPLLSVLKARISDRRIFREALISGYGVNEYQGGDNLAADEINALLSEVLDV